MSALFGQPNQNKVQQQMFDSEMQMNREQSAIEQAGVGDDVFFAQKEKTEELTKWQQDLRDEAELTIHDLRREIQDKDGNYRPMLEFTGRYVEVNGKKKRVMRKVKPIINDIGINMFRTSIRPSLSRNLIMSNYTEDRILLNLKRDVINYIRTIGYYNKEYEIEKGNMSTAVLMLKKIIEPSFFRALNNGERSYLNTINKRIEAVAYGNQAQPQQKKGLLNQLMG